MIKLCVEHFVSGVYAYIGAKENLGIYGVTCISTWVFFVSAKVCPLYSEPAHVTVSHMVARRIVVKRLDPSKRCLIHTYLYR